MKLLKKSMFLFILLTTLWFRTQSQNSETLKDIDGNIYSTAIIGEQIWMVENLRTTSYKNGIRIPFVTADSLWKSLKSSAYCWYSNDNSNGVKLGALYNWYAVNTESLCPNGWRVPTDDDWKQLEIYADSKCHVNDTIWNTTMLRGYDTGKKLKSKSGWNTNGSGLDILGFTAIPAGERSGNKFNFRHLGSNGFWWTSSEFNDSLAWYRCLVFFDDRIIRNTHPKTMGFSVRCVKDL